PTSILSLLTGSIARHTALLQSRRTGRHKACVLLLECLGDATAPALGDGLRRRVREDVLFVVLQTIEDALRDGLGRSLGDLESARHVGVDGTQENAVDLDSLTCQQRPQ